MIKVNVLLTEQEMAKSFLLELQNHHLPEHFFYWFPLSVQAWLNLCSDGAYKNFMRSFGLIEKYADDIATQLPEGKIDVISLGAGQGDKDAILLQALEAAGCSINYHPVDASQTLLEIACLGATQLGFNCQGVKANIANLSHLESIFPPKTSSGTRLVLLLGNTLGAFDVPNYLNVLRNFLTPDDFMLVDGELYAETKTISGYDNPLNRTFAFAPLQSIGISNTDGELRFQMKEDESLPGFYRLTKHFLPCHDFFVQVAGQTLQLKKDEKIEMSHSGKYSLDTFWKLMNDIGNFRCRAAYKTEDESFVLTLVTPNTGKGEVVS